MGTRSTSNAVRRKRRSVARPRKARSRRHGTWRALVLLSVGVAGLLTAGWVGYSLWREGSGKPSAPRQEVPSRPPSAQMEVTLFFSDDQGEYLVAEVRRVPKVDGTPAVAQAVVQEIIRGPRSGLQPTLPKGTQLRRGPVCAQSVCTLDFSEELVRNHPGGSSTELMTVYSLVESLRASIPGVHSVQILVEGKSRETLAGHISIGVPVRTDPRYIRNQRSSQESHPRGRDRGQS